jgi:FOG: HPt domain
MSASLFGCNSQLDVAFLDEAYANDAETASYVFQMYLDELPANLRMIQESIASKDIERFKQLIHKQKPGFSYVGLTDVTANLEELQKKCLTVNDLAIHETEIDEVIKKIHSSVYIIEKALVHLKEAKRA